MDPGSGVELTCAPFGRRQACEEGPRAEQRRVGLLRPGRWEVLFEIATLPPPTRGFLHAVPVGGAPRRMPPALPGTEAKFEPWFRKLLSPYKSTSNSFNPDAKTVRIIQLLSE